MSSFWWIPALLPLLFAFIILVCPGKWAWPISRLEGARSDGEIRENWGKFGIFLIVNFLASLIFASLSWFGAVQKQRFPEVWNMQVTGIRHEMQWTTHETRHETYYTGSGENRKSHTRTIHYTQKHGPYWYKTDEYNDESLIGEGEYNHWKSVWANESQTGMHKGSSAGFESIDGPIFACRWPGTFETIFPETSIRKYVNKIRVSHSVLKWGEATKEQMVKYPRPADKGNPSPVISYGPGVGGNDLLYLQRVNASLGRRHEIHAILVLFGKDVGRQVVEEVLTAWQGPNKNELVTFASLDGQTIRWVEVHSWMDNTTIHATLRDALMGQPFTAKRYGELLRQHVPKLWQRKHFTPINAYLRVSINPLWIWLAFGLTVVCGIVSYIVIERKSGGSGKT